MTAAGVFYPAAATTAEERLQHYAATFPLVEVDATYYALPAETRPALWVERTPPDFVFDIKAHALMTGQGTETKRLPKALREELPEPVATKPRVYAKDLPTNARRRSGRCSATVSHPCRRGPAGLDPARVPALGLPVVREPRDDRRRRRAAGGLRCAVEFRNAAWLNEKNAERTLRFLRDQNAAS